MNSNWSCSLETLNSGKNWRFFIHDLEIWWMTLKNNRAPLLWYFKLCASFHSHRSIPTGVRVLEPQMRVKISDFLSHVTFKYDRWPWKAISHLFYATSSFVHHFIAICEFNLELRSGNAQFGSKLVIFCPVWPWNLTDYLENNWAPLLCNIKLCASFHCYMWIHTGVIVQKWLNSFKYF